MTELPAVDLAQHRLTMLSQWIDEHNAHRTPLEQLLMRIVKIPEEKGEMAAEIIGMTGQNPRKGVTSDIDKVIDEALDWAVTALGVVEHATGNQSLAFNLLFEKLAKINARMEAAPSADEIPSDVKIDKFLDRESPQRGPEWLEPDTSIGPPEHEGTGHYSNHMIDD